MYTEKHSIRRTFLFDRPGYYRLYLNEAEGVEITSPVGFGYSYTGPEKDGSTVIAASAATYEDFVSGLIRLSYSAAAAEAIIANKTLALAEADHEKAAEYDREWKAFQRCRQEAKETVRALFSRL